MTFTRSSVCNEKKNPASTVAGRHYISYNSTYVKLCQPLSFSYVVRSQRNEGDSPFYLSLPTYFILEQMAYKI